MGRIFALDSATSSGIAAGEVVERPASVVKELIENAIDAGASVVTIEIAGGGISLIRITDDGCGMDKEDAKLAFLCHATSKLKTLDDLFSLHTMGFRGEALASIAAASRVNLKTRQPGDEAGTEVVIEAGQILRISPVGGPSGTRIEVRDLFYNLPARYKFLKKDQTETQYITVLCERFALIRPDISFRLICQGKELIHTPGNNDSQSSLYCIYGRQIVDQCIPIDESYGELFISGFAGKPEISKGSRGDQVIFVNDRLIRSKVISSAIDEAYKTMLMKGRYAFVILSIRVPSQLLDVNVHPQKAEVRFWNDNEVFRAVFHVIQNALLSSTYISEPVKLFDSTNKSYTDSAITPNSVSSGNSGIVLGGNNDIPFVSPPVSNKYKYPSQNEIQAFNENIESYQMVNSDTINSDKTVSSGGAADCQSSGNSEFSLEDLLSARIIGVAFATYILLESGNHIILLDQHAAHEKILFEKLLRDYEQRGFDGLSSQPLLVPEIITMTPGEMLFLQEKSIYMNKSGFVYEPIGDHEIILREVPAIELTFYPAAAFRNTLERLKQETPQTDESLILLLATSACKAAVKGHDRLDELEIMALLSALPKLKNPYHCPHGRPIIIRISQNNLEKEFKRIG